MYTAVTPLEAFFLFYKGDCLIYALHPSATAAMIRGNHTNCSQFAQAQRLNWLFSKLGSQAGGEGAGMMDVLYCILNDSPEALNMMKEEHIKVSL